MPSRMTQIYEEYSVIQYQAPFLAYLQARQLILASSRRNTRSRLEYWRVESIIQLLSILVATQDALRSQYTNRLEGKQQRITIRLNMTSYSIPTFHV